MTTTTAEQVWSDVKVRAVQATLGLALLAAAGWLLTTGEETAPAPPPPTGAPAPVVTYEMPPVEPSWVPEESRPQPAP